MLSDFLKKNIDSQASTKNGGFVDYGYGQVEPNHLSAQRTAQVYAQLPADAAIEKLEQGQFVKYDYANGLVNFTGVGEWMLVYNEIKLYREHQDDCEFAMLKDNYQARIYSPFGFAVDKNGAPAVDEAFDRQARYLNGKDAAGATSMTMNKTFSVAADAKNMEIDGRVYAIAGGKVTYNDTEYTISNGSVTIPVVYAYDDVTASPDMYEIHYNEDPMHFVGPYKAQKMPEGTTMVPRVLKTNVGDIFTTNMIKETALVAGDLLTPGADGILAKANASMETSPMVWQVAKVYTMPDHQKGAKLVRVK